METAEGEYTVNTNDILYLPQGLAYTAHYTETEMITFHFVTEHNDSGIQVFSFENGEKIYKTFLQARESWKSRSPGFPLFAMSALYAVLGMICRKETHAQLPPHFLRAVSILNSSFTNGRLNLGEVCTEAGIAQSRFRQLFRLHYSKTPVDYLTDLRIEHARSCIAGGMSVEAAAEASGFNDPKYFARTVKKRFGCTPKSFKTYGK
jgi:AraC-like DNA-binding protein